MCACACVHVHVCVCEHRVCVHQSNVTNPAGGHQRIQQWAQENIELHQPIHRLIHRLKLKP